MTLLTLAAAAADAAHGAEQGGGGGLPQMDPGPFLGQLFWLALLFGLLYLALSRVAIPRISAVLEERRDKIADDLDKAGELKAQAEAAVKAYDKAVADAKGRARKLADETRAQLKAEGDKRRAEAEAQTAAATAAAEARIASMKAEALSNVRGVAAGTAAAIVTKLTGESVGEAEAAEAVDAALAA